MNVNKCILVGRTSKNPELKTTQSGQKVCTMSLATNHEWKDKSGTKNSKTEWHNLVFWGKLAEIVGQYVTKGQELYVEGRIEYREYENKEGQKVKVTDIIVEQMQMGMRAKGFENQSGQNYTPQDSRNITPGSNGVGEQPAPQENIPTINLDEEPTDEIKLEDVPF
ncbi:MAG: single-stranded DNA-binding protein [Methanolobus sp.]|nr:single-stranded DNA-binding protein [Methanolobus sp.]